MTSSSDGGRVVATSLETVVADELHIEKIRDAVQRVHKMTIDATELMAMHVTRCLHENLPPPDVTNANWVKSVMMEVSKIPNAKGDQRKNEDLLLSETRQRYMPSLELTDRSRLDQLLMFQATMIAANTKTNLWFHMRKRVFRFVRQQHPRSEDMDKKIHKLMLHRLCDDLCKPVGLAFESDELHHEWITEWKTRLHLHNLKYQSMEYNVKTNTTSLIHATWEINRVLEDAGEKCISCIPFRRQMRPGFCNFDTRAIAAVLGLGKKDTCSLEEWKNTTWRNVLHFGKSIKVPSGSAFGCSMRTDGVSVRLVILPMERATTSKSRTLKGKKRHRDEDDAKEASTSKNTPSSISIPRPALYTIDQIKHLSRTLQHATVVGADPGKSELLVCARVYPDAAVPKAPSVRYTSAQRRHETSTKLHAELAHKEMPPSLQEGTLKLSEYSSRSSYPDRLGDYFKTRRTMLKDALEHYGNLKYRYRAWTRFRREQRSITDFVRRIKGLADDKDSPIILAYGSWANVAGKPGRKENKGHPSCIGKGLRAKLAKHFVVVSTPEAWTSKTCSKCGGRCDGCMEVDNRCRQFRDQICQRIECGILPSTTRRPPLAARGLRRCTNPDCGIFLNRDHNAAVNIGRRCADAIFHESNPQDYFPSWADASTRDVDAYLDALETKLRDPA